MFNVYINDGQKEIPDDDICYIVGKEGIFLKKRMGIMDSMAPVKSISILKSISASAKMHIPKIPAQSFAKVIEFFRDVCSKYYGESIVLLFYNEQTKKFRIIPPKQEVSAATLDYKRAVTIEGFIMIGDIHSHARMSAFHSGVDDKDEESFDGLHITIGNVDENDVSISASIVANGYRIMVNPSEYISGIKLTKDVDKTATDYTTKVYKLDPKTNKAILDVEASKKTSYTYRKFDKRYISTVSASKRKYNPSWMKFVEKKTYVWPGYSAGYGGVYGSGWGNHYDPHAWNQFHKVGSKPPIHAQLPAKTKPGSKVSPLNVGPNSIGTTFPPHEQIDENAIPCLTCKFKACKMELEDEELLEDAFYKCEQCNIIISNESDNIVCPTCKTDEHLTLIDESEMVDFYAADTIETAQNLQPNQEGEMTCQNCFNTFLKLETDINCPYCDVLLTEYGTIVEEMERQLFSDTGAFLQPETEEINKEAIRQASEVEKIADPMKPEIPIPKGPTLKSMFQKVFGDKGGTT